MSSSNSKFKFIHSVVKIGDIPPSGTKFERQETKRLKKIQNKIAILKAIKSN